ncbi:glycoside hydrolase family 3 C-terminal domain-containing protein [Paeniglutamicibacter psychrophenolicus]|uniref:Beta-glucosidase n=1 Tax=Paeniglutamicibacter psychrophenolicus TaxID=257454 RepID=A0ABS4WA86_9MICC|nr:glycoside hydrolase family 3 protein [Paeniglutamicibacter psychrophenolicus]MBP2372941.1 beta-glucosidase [Paeniglutamicibacter psychrophenolicus]
MSEKIPTELTIQEKASLTTGRDFWSTSALAPAQVPSLILTDGPHGLRLQTGDTDHLGLAASVPATCFPPAVTLGSTFDVSLLERVGAAIGAEARAQGVAVVLGPGINIKRSPLCGRNFEYLSEDPLVSGVLGSALVDGLQSRGVGASVKHFAANNQEADRMRVSADVDPRPLREIYLRAFERVVRTAGPWTVMCSYNRINGVTAAENRWLLTDVLRKDWGFDGVVVSDWGAVTDRVRSLEAGLDLEMPGNPGNSIPHITAAIESGELDEAVLDESVGRLIDLAAKTQPATGPSDLDANHALAREAAGKGIVLLKNEGKVLPVRAGTSLAVIGEFARSPRYQGAGSSQVNPTRVETFLDEIRSLHSSGPVDFAPGYTLVADAVANAELAAAAVAAAGKADTVIFMAGLPGSVESEGFDRTTLELPASQLELLGQVRAANPNVVVALVGGGVVELPFADDVPAILAAWLGGQAGGGALADVLTGKVNPSGRLAETIPLRLEDTPAALDFPGEHGHVRYGEGIFVGYRWYDARKATVRYPFGHGLGYTDFEYSELEIQARDDGLRATVKLRNTGAVAGREIVQLYLGLPGSAVARAPRSLAAFTCIEMQAGQETEVELLAGRSELAYWDTRVDGWTVEPGSYEVAVGASSRDVRLAGNLELPGDNVQLEINEETTLGELLADPIGGAIMAQVAGEALGGITGGGSDEDGETASMMATMLGSLPIGRLVNFPGSPMTRESLAQLIGGIQGARAAAAAGQLPPEYATE